MTDNLISILGLPTAATEEQILTALSTRLTEHAAAVAEISRLRALAQTGGLPASITPEVFERKLRAGLDRSQALDVCLAQAAHDQGTEGQAAEAAEAKSPKAKGKGK